MFKSARFYAILNNRSLIIKKEGEDSENRVHFSLDIPNVPFYFHFFDEEPYIADLVTQINKMRIKDITIVAPDDAVDLEVDKRVLTEFFRLRGVRKVQMKAQCDFLNIENRRYISISRTTRAIVMKYLVNGKHIAKKYYDKNYEDIKQIQSDVKSIHPDCEYESIPVYINDMNNDMDKFKPIGTLISSGDVINNIMNDNVG